MIIDSFIFNGELDMLEFRLKLLWDHVDKFVIVESDHTFSGMPKTYHFMDNRARFDWAKDKIVYCKASSPPHENPWQNEARQREEIINACRRFSDADLLIISDVDEIPTLQAIKDEIETGCLTRVCAQHSFYYNLRTLRKELWKGTIFCALGVARKNGVQFMRDRRNNWIALSDSGWHLSYFGDSGYIRDKIESFSHQEYNTSEFTDERHIKDCIDKGLDLFKRGTESLCPPQGFFPDYFVEKAKSYNWGLKPDSCYANAGKNIEDLVPRSARRVLDVGCGHGVIGASLRLEQEEMEVTGIEINPEIAEAARKNMDRVITGDIEEIDLPFEAGYFDCIILADILEHLVDPWNTLKKLVRHLSFEGVIIASIPNIRNLAVVRTLLDGSWRYEESGILDKTHLRFFALEDMKGLFEQAGIDAQVVETVADARFADFLKGPQKANMSDVQIGDLVLKDVSPAQIRELTAQQFIFTGRRKKSAVSACDFSKAGPEQPAVSIVIPVFNNAALTRKCLAALKKNTAGCSYEVIVIDNASDDETPELLKSCDLQNLTVISNRENVGFTKACNQGARRARGEFTLFLNNDTEPQPGWLDALLDLMRSDDRIGVAGCRLVYPDGRLQEAGGIIFNDGSGWNYGRFDDLSDPRYCYVREVDYVSGAALLVRNELLRRLDYFDEQYSPGYYEDTDLCFGVRSLGYKVMYCPFSIVVHHEGASSGTDLSRGMKRHQVVNKEKFARKWASALKQQYPPDRRIITMASSRSTAGDVLIIDPFLPMFDRASGSLRLFSIISLLRRQEHHVTYIARYGEGQERYRMILERMGVEVYATDPAMMREMGRPVNARPIDLEQLLTSRRYAVAYLSFHYIARQYLSGIRSISPLTRVVIDTVDIHFLRQLREAELYRDRAAVERAESAKEAELAIYSRADALITVTEQDWRHIEGYLPAKQHFVIPNIHSMPDSPGCSPSRSGLLFIGNFNHNPNKDAVFYFIKDIFPLVKKAAPDMTLRVVGSDPPDSIRGLRDKGVTATGYVPSTEPYLQKARVSIAPLRYGAGMKGKIGEAMAHGLPVVTTSVGAEGMGLVHGETALIADTPEEFALYVVKLCSDDGLWSAMSENARLFIRNNYSPEVVSAAVHDMMSRLSAMHQKELSGEARS